MAVNVSSNAESFDTLEEATRALTNTAQRAATLMRQEADRARSEAGKAREEAEAAWGQIETVRSDILSAKQEIDAVRGTILNADAENKRLRGNVRSAWSAVGVMAVLMMVAVGWTASTLTRNATRVSFLSERLEQVSTVAENRSSELERLRAEVSVARIAQARAEGELRAVGFTRPFASSEFSPVSTWASPSAVAPELAPAVAPVIEPVIESVEPVVVSEVPSMDLQLHAGPTTRPVLRDLISGLLVHEGLADVVSDAGDLVQRLSDNLANAGFDLPAPEASAQPETSETETVEVTALPSRE